MKVGEEKLGSSSRSKIGPLLAQNPGAVATLNSAGGKNASQDS